MNLNIFYNSPCHFCIQTLPTGKEMSYLKYDWLLVTLQWEHEEVIKAEGCRNYHLLTPHWFGSILLCYAALWIPGEMMSEWLCVRWSWATAWCVLRDLLGFMHNALCVSWEGWTSDREDWVPSRISNGLRSLSPCAHTALPLSLLCYLLETANIIDVAFSCVWHENKGWCFLSMLSPSFSPTLSVFILPFSLQSVLLPFFYLWVLMIYFARMSDLCSNRVLRVTSKEGFMSIISTANTDSEKIR